MLQHYLPFLYCSCITGGAEACRELQGAQLQEVDRLG